MSTNLLKLNKRMFYFFAVLICILALLYTYFVSATVFNIVERKQFQEKSQLMLSNIGKLQLQYLEKNSKISLELASSLGFQKLDKVYFTSPTAFARK